MATKLLFFDVDESRETQLECFATDNETILIEIDTSGLPTNWILLDKDTAIKLSKVLKSEISKI
jgi:hypothetical protein